MNVARDHIERHRPAYVVVTVAYRSRPLLKAMLERIAPPTPIIVVDNSADHEDITDLVHARPMTTYIDAGGNIGFGAACNLAASVASQPFMAFVNPDADVDVAVLDRLVDKISSDSPMQFRRAAPGRGRRARFRWIGRMVTDSTARGGARNRVVPCAA